MSWNLKYEGDRSMVYLMHYDESGKSNFVARFKYAHPKSSAKHFAKFLAKNFSPAEYFAARAANPGSSESSPLKILESKGYESYNSMRFSKALVMKELGLVKVKGAAGGTYWE